jgi:hypothetical protein
MTVSISTDAIMLHVAFSYCYAECRYVERRYTECRGAGKIDQNIISAKPS